MTQSLQKSIRKSINNWWLILLSGVLMIIFGFWVIFSPLASYLYLSLFFAWGVLLVGIFEIAFVVSKRKGMDSRGWILATGLLDLVIGLFLLSYPWVTMTILSIILGFWLLYRGVSSIGSALSIKSYGVKNWAWFFFLGIGIIIFGTMVLVNPIFGAGNIIIWTGSAFIFAGIFRIYLAVKLRRLQKMIAPKI